MKMAGFDGTLSSVKKSWERRKKLISAKTDKMRKLHEAKKEFTACVEILEAKTKPFITKELTLRPREVGRLARKLLKEHGFYLAPQRIFLNSQISPTDKGHADPNTRIVYARLGDRDLDTSIGIDFKLTLTRGHIKIAMFIHE